MNIEVLGKLIESWRKHKGLTGQGLADMWQGNKSTVSQIEAGKSEPSYKVLSSLRRTGMSIDRLIDKAEGINTVAEAATGYQSEPLPTDETDLLKNYRNISPEDKACILRMIKGLRQASD